MRELEAIISTYEGSPDRDFVLATVVHVEGSSYRKAGARMLVDEEGRMTGAISGGCLEGDALRKALHALHQGRNKLITYDTSDESDAVIGAQLGCNGVIRVLFEPVSARDAHNPVELLKSVAASERPMVIITLFNLDHSQAQGGTVMVFDESMRANGKVSSPALAEQLHADAERAFVAGHKHFATYKKGGEEQGHAFIELYSPPPRLVLVGAGNDAQQLASLAAILGWRITVTDGRPTHAREDRFTSSCQVVVSHPEEVLTHIRVDERTVFVLISHNYGYDLAVLKLLLDRREVPYIGILGSRGKFDRILQDLEAEGLAPDDEQMKRIFAPVGLSIGGESPSEIGLSIIAEIQMVLTGSSGGSLRDQTGPIHTKQYNDFKVTPL
ncbi:XdhC family protein [Roseivirga sp. BDSF3-8]|uniref:XdhC family protein n=1 Tax=Roseivirga sp. BDSF3-8 TaxID=3241598 RepID=UPI003531D0E3